MARRFLLSGWPTRLAVIVLAGGGAYFAGIGVADAVSDRRLIKQMEADREETDLILKGSGDHLRINMTFELESLFDLQGNPFDAKSLVGGGLTAYIR